MLLAVILDSSDNIGSKTRPDIIVRKTVSKWRMGEDRERGTLYRGRQRRYKTGREAEGDK